MDGVVKRILCILKFLDHFFYYKFFHSTLIFHLFIRSFWKFTCNSPNSSDFCSICPKIGNNWWTFSIFNASIINDFKDQHNKCHYDAQKDYEKNATNVLKLNSFVLIFSFFTFYSRRPIFFLQFVQIVFIHDLYKAEKKMQTY